MIWFWWWQFGLGFIDDNLDLLVRMMQPLIMTFDDYEDYEYCQAVKYAQECLFKASPMN